jgi:hypothetical protein
MIFDLSACAEDLFEQTGHLPIDYQNREKIHSSYVQQS